MNRVFQVVWSDDVGAWVVVSELASRRRKARRVDARIASSRTPSIRRTLLAFGLIAGAPFAGLHAQSLHWDGTDTNANANGGNGTWQDGATNWDSAATAGANTAWNGAIPNDAVFGGVAGTVTIAPAGVTARNLTFNLPNYTISGGVLTLAGATPTISNGGMATITSVVAGTSGVTKTGAGILQLNGANTYTGLTRVQQGLLRLNHAQALGLAATAASNLIVSNGAGIDFQATSDAHNLTANGGTITLSGIGTWSGAPTLTANTTIALSGITQTGAWTDTGANVLSVNTTGAVLGGANTYTGQTLISSGQLAVGNASGLSANSNLAIGGTVAAQWIAVLALTNASANFARTLGTGANQVRWTGSGGFASVNSGTQVVDIGGSGATLTWGTTPNFVAANQHLMLGIGNNVLGSGTIDFRNALALPTAGTNYDLAVYNGSVASGRAKLSGVVSGAGNLRVGGNVAGAGSGLLELSAANTYTGNLVLAGAGNYGNVLLNNASAASGAGGINIAGPASAVGDTLSLTAASGHFTRALGTGANQVQWTGNGGFSATGANRFVDLGGAGATVTWGSGNFVPTGSWLNLAATTAGDAEIEFRNPINLGAAARTINIGLGGTARLSGTLSGTGGVTYQGGGQVTVAGTNTYTGITTIANTNVVASAIGNGGAAGNLGAAGGAASNLVFNSGTLTYTGAGETSNRNFTLGTSNATLAANGTGALSLAGATAGAGTHALTLRGTSGPALANQLTGSIGETGGGTITVAKIDNNTWRLANMANTYSGFTSFGAGVLEVAALQNGGAASSIGDSSNAAANLRAAGGTLRYLGAGGSTDRAMQFDATSALESSGTGAIAFTSTNSMALTGASGSGSGIFTLGGTNTGANVFAAALANFAGANNENQNATGLAKSGTGAWTLTAAAPTYTGNTTINAGVLYAGSAGAITGGFGTTSNAGSHPTYVVSTPMSSLIQLNGGVLGLTAASGDFTRALTTATQSFNNAGTTGVANRGDDVFLHAVRFIGGGGFAALGGDRIVDLGGAGAGVTWNTGGFVTTGRSLVFSDASADSMVAFLNPIAFAGGVRSIDVANGSAAVDGELRGTLSGAGASGLQKQGDGELRLAGDESFDAVQVLAGTLSVDADRVLTAQHTMLAADATLRIEGAFHGTQRDDTFDAAGTVIGALDFGDGNDAVTFADANIAGITSLAGGAGADRLVFDGMTFDGDALANVSGFERAMLANGSVLSLSRTLALDVLAIDATSSLLASTGARIDGAVENAGTLRVDSGRLAIAGDYTGTAGAMLVLAVSPANGTSGGLDIAGDVHGTTQIVFDSDGSVVTGPTAIKIIDSPNDVPGEGTFTATRTRDGFVRLTGSVFNWGFAQDVADGDWYLRTEANDGAQGLSLLPELPAYGALPTIGALAARSTSGLAFAHIERIDAECGGEAARSNLAHRDDCHRAWVAATADEVTVGANPGVAFSGDTTGLYVGADIFGHDTATHTVRGGVFAGQQRGNHWTTGEASGGVLGAGGANVRTETPAFGMYGRVEWNGGLHLDGSAIGQLHENNIATTDGFREKIAARSVALNLRGGREVTLGSGWKLDPQLALGAYGMRWQDKVDASGKPLAFEDDVIGTAHASLRIERAFLRPGGATWRPWATLGVEDTFGANADAVRVAQGAIEQAIPNHAWDLGATLDAGVEFASNAHVSWFGSVSLGESLDGTDLSRGQAMLGARVRW